MGLAFKTLSAARAAKTKKSIEKTEVRLFLETDLTDQVKWMKAQLKEKTGCYFSLSKICEIAIENALKQAERELNKSEEDSDPITML